MTTPAWDTELAACVAEFPKFHVRPFSDGWVWRVLKKLGWGMGGITLYNVVYLEDSVLGTDRGANYLRHEIVHVRQQHNLNVLFFIMYFLLPIGPSLKAMFEWEAYKEDLRGCREAFKHLEHTDPGYYAYITEYYCQWVSGQFASPLYLWMWPFKSAMYKKSQEFIKSLP